MNDAATERNKRIKRDYLGYLKLSRERDADPMIDRIYKTNGDVDKVISSVVNSNLHEYPDALTPSFFAIGRERPKSPAKLMANDAYHLTHGLCRKVYREHRTKFIQAAVTSPAEGVKPLDDPAEGVKPLDDPACYIAKVAKGCCIDELRGGNLQDARVRRCFKRIISDCQKQSSSRFFIRPAVNFIGKELGTNVVGLTIRGHQVNIAEKPRVRQLLDRPDEVRSQENFKVWHIKTRKDMEELMAEALTYCGGAIDEADLWRVVKHCCRVEFIYVDDVSEQTDPRTDVEGQVIGDVMATKKYLFAQLTANQRDVLMLRFGEESNKEMSYREIGERLGISEGAANDRFRDAVKALRREADKTGNKGLISPQQENVESRPVKGGK